MQKESPVGAEGKDAVDNIAQVNAIAAELEYQRNFFASRCVTFAAESAAKYTTISQLHDRVKVLESIEATLRAQILMRKKK
jgi:hypothetical protein